MIWNRIVFKVKIYDCLDTQFILISTFKVNLIKYNIIFSQYICASYFKDHRYLTKILPYYIISLAL